MFVNNPVYRLRPVPCVPVVDWGLYCNCYGLPCSRIVPDLARGISRVDSCICYTFQSAILLKLMKGYIPPYSRE